MPRSLRQLPKDRSFGFAVGRVILGVVVVLVPVIVRMASEAAPSSKVLNLVGDCKELS